MKLGEVTLMDVDAKEFIAPEPLGADDHQLVLRECKILRQHLVTRGESETLNLLDAVARLAPTGSRKARTNVLRARTGQYVGVYAGTGENFVIVNPTRDGDIRWLLNKRPEIRSSIKEVYLVEDVVIRRNTIDLGTQSPAGAA